MGICVIRVFLPIFVPEVINTKTMLWQELTEAQQQIVDKVIEAFESPISRFFRDFGEAYVGGFVLVPLYLVLFWLITWPLKMVAVHSKNYKWAMRSRDLSDIILFVLIGYMIYDILLEGVLDSRQTELYPQMRDILLSLTMSVLLIVPLYQLIHKWLGRQPFYNEEHTQYLQHFILFLRSFKDDEKYKKSEKKLMVALKDLFHPYAIGKPDELMPPQGAKRIYVGEHWQELVIELQRKAPVILQRINMTDNFLWEFDQCVQNGYLGKVIFWVADYDDYERFQQMVTERYGMWFPRLFKDPKAETLFYQKDDGTYEIYPLKEDKDYKAFASHYMSLHPQLTEQCAEYLYGREKSAGAVLKRREPDPQLPEGIEGWDWMACLFPQFYVVCHALKSKWTLYFLTVVLLLLLVGLSPFGLLYLLPMAALGKNGRALSWLSHRWESRAWFEKNYKRDNQITLVLGIAFWVLQLLLMLSWLVLA